MQYEGEARKRVLTRRQPVLPDGGNGVKRQELCRRQVDKTCRLGVADAGGVAEFKNYILFAPRFDKRLRRVNKAKSYKSRLPTIKLFALSSTFLHFSFVF